jgi:hypothetical protein
MECCSATFNEGVALLHESAAQLFVCTAHKINYKLRSFLHEEIFMKNTLLHLRSHGISAQQG